MNINSEQEFLSEQLHIADKLFGIHKICSLELTPIYMHYLHTTFSPTCRCHQYDFYYINYLV